MTVALRPNSSLHPDPLHQIQKISFGSLIIIKGTRQKLQPLSFPTKVTATTVHVSPT